MENANNEQMRQSWAQSVTQAPSIVLRLLILQRRDDVIDAIASYELKDARRVRVSTARLRSVMWALYWEIQGSFSQDDKAEQAVLDALANEDYGGLVDAFAVMSTWMYVKGLTKFDGRKNVDTTRVEVESAAHGL